MTFLPVILVFWFVIARFNYSAFAYTIEYNIAAFVMVLTTTYAPPPLSHAFPQYVTKASSTLRMALKEPAKSKAMAQETFAYNRAHWTDGNMGTKSLVDALKSVGK